jgi:hypothetical protein
MLQQDAWIPETEPRELNTFYASHAKIDIFLRRSTENA